MKSVLWIIAFLFLGCSEFEAADFGFEDEDIDESKKQHRYLIYAPSHELGHFYGLDHQFDYTEDNKSIMGYKIDFTELQPYDKKAVRALYSEVATD